MRIPRLGALVLALTLLAGACGAGPTKAEPARSPRLRRPGAGGARFADFARFAERGLADVSP